MFYIGLPIVTSHFTHFNFIASQDTDTMSFVTTALLYHYWQHVHSFTTKQCHALLSNLQNT